MEHDPKLVISFDLFDKVIFSKYKKIKITPCILSAHNAIKFELTEKKKKKQKLCK
jgi:hypothetical protein